MFEQMPEDRGKGLPAMGPGAFNGKFASFRQWWKKRQDYPEIDSPSLPTDRIKIQTAETYMRGRACIWYQPRRRTIEAKHTPDNWSAFQSPLVDCSTDQMDRRMDWQRMMALEYKGDNRTT